MHYNPRVVEAQPRVVLKLGRKRTTSVATDAAGGAQVVIKRFHDRGFLGRSLDRFRCRAEFHTLRALHRRGLPVPEPIEFRASEGAFELVTRFVDNAVTLADIAEGIVAWPCAPERAARALGEALAQAHELGLDHPDLHAGNVLVGEDARVWLVDVRGARLQRQLADELRVRDLVVLAADLRERLSPRFRARVLVAWWRALSPGRRARATELRRIDSTRGFASADGTSDVRGERHRGLRLADLADEIEWRARERRRAVVLRSRLRWTRASSVTVAIHGGFRTRRFSSDDSCATRTDASTRSVTGSAEVVREAWWTAARLAEHAIAAARPIAIEFGATSMALFEGACRPLEVLEHAPRDARDRRRIAHSLGELAGALFDRGLVAECAFELDSIPHVRLGPGARLSFGDLRNPSRLIESLDEFRGNASHRERALFCAAFVRAQRSRPKFTAELRARLRDG